jgi:phosphoglycolate phosphatase-like HAD superfamily hydrolase
VVASPEAAELVRRARTVLFDCDDTLLATAKTRWHILIATARSFRVTLTREAITAAWGLPFDRFVRTVVPTVDPAAFVGRYRLAMSVSRPEAAKGAPELLEHLAARSVRMEILTGGSRALITQDLDALDLTRHFARIYGHEETPFHKPDPRVLDDVLANLAGGGHNLAELVYIGDSVRDFRVAAARAVPFVAVLSGLEPAADFVAAGLPPEQIVDDLTQLLPR